MNLLHVHLFFHFVTGRKPGKTRILTITPEKPETLNVKSSSTPASKPTSLFSSKSRPTSPDTSSDSDGVMSLHESDSSEEHFSESENEDVQHNESKLIVEVNLKLFTSEIGLPNVLFFFLVGELRADDYVIFKLVYDVNTRRETYKFFMAQVINVNPQCDRVSLKVMRRKGMKAFHFPYVEEVRDVTRECIVQKMKNVSFRRGYLIINEQLNFQISF